MPRKSASRSPTPVRRELPPKLKAVSLGQQSVRVFGPKQSVNESRVIVPVVSAVKTGAQNKARKESLKKTQTKHPGAAAAAAAGGGLGPSRPAPFWRKSGKGLSKGKAKGTSKRKSSVKGKGKGKSKGKGKTK